MFVAFHQNMLRFNGGNVERNNAFIKQMGKINKKFPTDPVGAAGYTEIVNDKPGVHQNLPAIAQALDAGLTNYLIIAVGITGAAKDPEYIGIAWDPRLLEVEHAGQVVALAKYEWFANNTEEKKFPKDRTLALPSDTPLIVDQRGLAYIACRRVMNKKPFLIGFVHNMY